MNGSMSPVHCTECSYTLNLQTPMFQILLVDSVPSNLQADGDKFTEQLNSFKDCVQSIVSDWLGHYCNAVGISDPTQFSRPTSRLDSRARGVSSHGRMVKSSMDYTTGSAC